MAYGILSKPGTEYGPCAGACHHRDCAANRATAEGICHHCGDVIGYDKKYSKEDDGRPVHWVCAMKDADEQRPTVSA